MNLIWSKSVILGTRSHPKSAAESTGAAHRLASTLLLPPALNRLNFTMVFIQSFAV